MKSRLFALALLLSAVALISCRKAPRPDNAVSAPPAIGALYSLSDGEGGYRVGKVLAIEEAEVVFINLFANRWTKRPTRSEARNAASAIPVAYSFQTFTGMQPVHLENGTTTPEELEAYEKWKFGKREKF